MPEDILPVKFNISRQQPAITRNIYSNTMYQMPLLISFAAFNFCSDSTMSAGKYIVKFYIYCIHEKKNTIESTV